jgi:hypothetical protein
LRAWADDPRLAEIVGPEPGWEAPLQLLGGMHYLVLGGEASWNDSPAEHAEFLSGFVRTQGVQTNEVQRSWVLVPLFGRVGERTGADVVDLVELGPSAGLNLVWDRYRCDYEAGAVGPLEARVLLRGEERRPVRESLLERVPRVRDRVGIDRAPIDLRDPEGARLLKAFVWADQTDRLERLDLAIETLRDDPPQLVRGDFVELLPAVLADRAPDAVTVVFQTAALGYVDEVGRARIRQTLADADERPLAFISAGNPRTGVQDWGLRIVYFPSEEREFVGHAEYHGRWLDLDV